MQSAAYTVRQLVDLAARLARFRLPRIAADRHDPLSLATYWVTSQARRDQWCQFLRAAARQQQGMPQPTAPGSARPRTLDWIEEILLSEMVTRLWTAAAVAHDHRHAQPTFEPIVRRVFLNHLEIRRRLLAVVLEGQTLCGKTTASVNQTRCRVERWTDLLLGYILPRADVAEFAFSAERARDHAAALHPDAQLDFDTWPLVLGSLRSTFQDYRDTRLPSSELNHQIEHSILASCRAEQNDSADAFAGNWQSRLEHYGDEAERLIARLLAS